jgi:uncharacterized membrane protein
METLTSGWLLARILPAFLVGGALLFFLSLTVLAPPLQRFVRRLEGRRAARTALAAGIALYALWLGTASLTRHWRVETETYDLGNVEQAIWNTLHGDFFRMTTDPEFESNLQLGSDFPDLPDTRWAFHVEPILFLALPFYRLFPRAETLLLLQTCFLAAGALPAYLAAREILGRRALGVAFAWLYLLSPNLHRAHLFDVHPFVFATPLLLGAYALACRGRPAAAFACVVATLACREDLVAPVAILALLWIAGRPRLLGLAALAAALLWGHVVFREILPRTNPEGYIYTKRLALAESPGALLGLARERPGAIPWFLTRPPRLAYYAYLGLPFGLAPLAAPHLLALAAPTFASVVFSTHGGSRLLLGHYHYHALLLPGLLLGAAAGLRRLTRRLPAPRRERVLIAATATMLALTIGTGLAWRDDAYAWPRTDRPRQAAVARAKRLIPPDASVAASYVLGAQVAGRRDLFTLYSPKRSRADYLFIAACEKPGCDGMARARVRAQNDEIRARRDYAVVFEEAGITLLRRRAAGAGRAGEASGPGGDRRRIAGRAGFRSRTEAPGVR